MVAQTIAQISFEEADQELFARLSGDHNPAHVDPLSARRSIFGRVVVHGMHCVLASLEALYTYMAEQGQNFQGGGLAARFIKPVYLGERLDVILTEISSKKLHISMRKGPVELVEIVIQAGASTPVLDSSEIVPFDTTEPATQPLECLIDSTGTVIAGGDPDATQKQFPLCSAALGLTRLSELLVLSRIVGMFCPGRDAVFTSLSIKFSGSKEVKGICYRVERIIETVRLVQLIVTGQNLAGRLEAFHLPPPPPISFKSLTQRLSPTSLKDQVAYIIGGSRGLGEATAKIIAAAGGQVVLTYRVGRDDAERIAADIRKANGSCHALQLDSTSLTASMALWPSELPSPTQIYYFATPKIFDKRGTQFDPDLFQTFNAVYVEGFAATCLALLDRFGNPLRVFYPSSVAIEENDPNLLEYGKAKYSGEALCRQLEKQWPLLSIHIERLPRLSTDQTINLAGVTGGDPVNVLLPLVAEMSEVSLENLLQGNVLL